MGVFEFSQFDNQPFHDYLLRFDEYVAYLASCGYCYHELELSHVILEGMNPETRALADYMSDERVTHMSCDEIWDLFRYMASQSFDVCNPPPKSNLEIMMETFMTSQIQFIETQNQKKDELINSISELQSSYVTSETHLTTMIDDLRSMLKDVEPKKSVVYGDDDDYEIMYSSELECMSSHKCLESEVCLSDDIIVDNLKCDDFEVSEEKWTNNPILEEHWIDNSIFEESDTFENSCDMEVLDTLDESLKVEGVELLNSWKNPLFEVQDEQIYHCVKDNEDVNNLFEVAPIHSIHNTSFLSNTLDLVPSFPLLYPPSCLSSPLISHSCDCMENFVCCPDHSLCGYLGIYKRRPPDSFEEGSIYLDLIDVFIPCKGASRYYDKLQHTLIMILLLNNLICCYLLFCEAHSKAYDLLLRALSASLPHMI